LHQLPFIQLACPSTKLSQHSEARNQYKAQCPSQNQSKHMGFYIPEGPDRRPEGGGLNGSLKFDPKIEEKKNPDSNTTPLLLKCANTTQHRQAASARNTI